MGREYLEFVHNIRTGHHDYGPPDLHPPVGRSATAFGPEAFERALGGTTQSPSELA